MIVDDWVGARAKCNVQALFDQLHVVVKTNAERAQKHIPGGRIEYYEREDQTFAVSREAPHAGLRFFYPLDDSIVVGTGRGQKDIATARPVLTDENVCLLKVQGHDEPMGVNQFSRLVLEDLFFPPQSGRDAEGAHR